MTAKIRATAKRATKTANRAPVKIARRKAAKAAPRTPVAAVADRSGAKVPSKKVAAAIALALRPEGVTPQEVMASQGWTARARHVQAWGKLYGYSVRAERDPGRVRFHMTRS